MDCSASPARTWPSVPTAPSKLSLVGQQQPRPERVTEVSVDPAVLWHMVRFRRWPCQPALLPARQLAKTERVSLSTAVTVKAGLRSSLVVRPELRRGKWRAGSGRLCEKSQMDREKGSKEREGVSRSSLHSTVTSWLSRCPQQPDMMS